jgi:hypothetical protein
MDFLQLDCNKTALDGNDMLNLVGHTASIRYLFSRLGKHPTTYMYVSEGV